MISFTTEGEEAKTDSSAIFHDLLIAKTILQGIVKRTIRTGRLKLWEDSIKFCTFYFLILST